jgi:hypothetical protein
VLPLAAVVVIAAIVAPVGLVQTLVALSIALTVVFVAALGHPRSPVAWMLASWGWITVAFESLLLAVTFRVHVPMWSLALVLAAQDGLFGWRLALLWRARRLERLSGEEE